MGVGSESGRGGGRRERKRWWEERGEGVVGDKRGKRLWEVRGEGWWEVRIEVRGEGMI